MGVRGPLTDRVFWIVVVVTLVVTIGYEALKTPAMLHGWRSITFIEAIFGDRVGAT